MSISVDPDGYSVKKIAFRVVALTFKHMLASCHALLTLENTGPEVENVFELLSVTS